MTMIYGAVLEGIEAVRVEVSFQPGTGPFDIRGLSEASARETRVRVRAALAASNRTPSGIVTVAREDGLFIPYAAGLDLAVAVAASGLPVGAPVLFAGELSLMGEIRGVRGAVSAARRARAHEMQCVVPAANKYLAVQYEGLVYAATLAEMLDAIEVASLPSKGGTGEWLLPLPNVTPFPPKHLGQPAWSDVEHVPVAAKIRAAVEEGARTIVLVGATGTGRTMISRRIPSILPALSTPERLEVDTIASAAGLETHGIRPFRAPHHTASTAAIVGGGTPVRPGEVTLAHHGVLLVDEANEMSRMSIDALIATLKNGETRVARMAASTAGHVHTTTMPARPAVTVISITLPTLRAVATKDLPITTREQASYDALTERYRALAARFVAELGAIVIECPKIEVRDLAPKGVMS